MGATRRIFLGQLSATTLVAGTAGIASAIAVTQRPNQSGPFSNSLVAEWAEDAPVVWLQRSVPPIRDPYQGLTSFQWWKGQLHTHTARSYDGDPHVPPNRRASLYQSAGYDFAVYTDHNKITGTPGGAFFSPNVEGAPSLQPGSTAERSSLDARDENQSILMLAGLESTDAKGHLGVWFFGPDRTAAADPPRVKATLPPVDRIRAWADAGALVACYHPSHPASPLKLERLEEWASVGVPFQFLEIFNTVATSTPDRLEYNLEAWRRVLTAAGPERPVWAIAADDSHRDRVGQGWVVVAAPALSPAALREALIAGRFYASSGPRFSTIGVDPESGGIAAEAPGAEVLRFIADDGAVRLWAKSETGLYLPHSKGDSERWVRVEAADGAGRTAWSQPFWVAA